ncbi:tryptophan synthase subunit alpha [Spongiibacter sp. KMU-158]|uniref:Tryptophan synthase alpha chain n=1 Tax=Spongiibacter pelagi TaxID=2760804 RepID=A0A927GWK9_9GAMM|nr:tryptophan synthase subunit alpha [Spongiibacter pelagi]MBD2859052.1 tryptophan synthase subunit alpha [Spongiibacter pelagi]
MSRLAGLFSELKNQGRKALVPYIVAGDPTQEITLPLMHELVAKGADILEIGVPFSDPMAEGPVIQLAHERALANHTSLSKTLEIVSAFRKDNQTTPVVLMGYTNPVERMGYSEFAKRATAAGVDGLLTVDLPPEEASELSAILAEAGIDNIFLLAPTSTDERIAQTAALASGYLYCVSLKGVTGAGHLDVEAVKAQMDKIRAHTDLPVTVGFGIKDGASASAVAPHCEGVVVGSALVESIAASSTDAAKLAACELIADIRKAIDSI